MRERKREETRVQREMRQVKKEKENTFIARVISNLFSRKHGTRTRDPSELRTHAHPRVNYSAQ